jgi:hypothetical protein
MQKLFNWLTQYGPAIIRVKSRIRTPDNGYFEVDCIRRIK